jgi:hypothetical protein
VGEALPDLRRACFIHGQLFPFLILGAPAFLDQLPEFFENCIAVEQLSTRGLSGTAFQLGLELLEGLIRFFIAQQGNLLGACPSIPQDRGNRANGIGT